MQAHRTVAHVLPLAATLVLALAATASAGPRNLDRAPWTRVGHLPASSHAIDATKPAACTRLQALKTLLPKARAAMFSTRSAIASQPDMPSPWSLRWCGAWQTTYRDYLGAGSSTNNPFFRVPATHVVVSLFATRRQALAAFLPGLPEAVNVLANGVRMRGPYATSGWTNTGEATSYGYAMSVVRNVMVSSESIWPPDAYSHAQLEAAIMRIHSRIHAAVLRVWPRLDRARRG